MAKQANGFLGGFVGSLGPAVGYLWKGRWCLRARARQVNNPRTEAQQEHRTLFKEEVRLAGRMRWAVNIGLKALSDEQKMTPQNLFVSINQEAFSPRPAGRTAAGAVGLGVDYARLRISEGPVAPVAVREWHVDEDNVLEVSFEKNPLHLSCSAYDNVYVWVWCPATGRGYLANAVYRRMRRMSVLLPEEMAGQELHVYAFVQDERGRCSATAYGAPAEGREEEVSGGAEGAPAAAPTAAPQGDERAAAEGDEKKISPI